MSFYVSWQMLLIDVEDKFIVCGRDKSVRVSFVDKKNVYKCLNLINFKIWSMNAHDEKFNSIKIDDFQCWKARFLVIFLYFYY